MHLAFGWAASSNHFAAMQDGTRTLFEDCQKRRIFKLFDYVLGKILL